MPVLSAVEAPWEPTLSTAQHDLIFYSLVVAGLALFAQFVRTWNSTSEIGSRYRTAVYASLCVTGVAFLAYLYLVVKFDSAYVFDGSAFVPTDESRNTYLPRYMDWSVTVPLLMVELLAIGVLKGAKARSTRWVLMSSAFLMIFTGFLGAGIIGAGNSESSLLLWGIISSVFYAVLYVVLLGMLRSAKGEMSTPVHASYRNAIILLLSVWGVYPIAFAIHNWFPGSNATTIIQVSFSFADIAAKVGLGALIHKIAKMRTAEDVNDGTETHPEAIWVSSVKLSDGLQSEVKGLSGQLQHVGHQNGHGNGQHDGRQGVREPAVVGASSAATAVDADADAAPAAAGAAAAGARGRRPGAPRLKRTR